LLKLSKSWFTVIKLQRELLTAEKQKSIHEKELVELEAKALRAQMNPHFIFNSLNSIKSLIQQNENEKSITYLTTFSKLIRNLFNNMDKREISLYDEIETCKLYLQLEAMRFDTKFSYTVNVDESIDLKSMEVPALIIQPFIENAIWHGIVPRNNGGKVSLNVISKNGVIEIVIDDNGIGREASQQNKSASGHAHQSKGVNLTQTRLELNNLLQKRQARLEVNDKRDEKGTATGTTVIIKIKEERS
jgi:LytS/YehU family sensor histidine kinase